MESIDGLHLCESEGMSPKKSDESAVCAVNYADLGPKSNDRLHELFTRFEAFNFDDDIQFQSGLTKISSLRKTSKTKDHAQEILKIKAFYYSKNIEPFDLAAYMEWNQKQTADPENRAAQQDSQACPKDDRTLSQQSAQSQQADSRPGSALSCTEQTSSHKPELGSPGREVHLDSSLERTAASVGEVCSSENSASDSGCIQELSFAEIAELIQSGKPIPGLSQIEVVPTNEAPTPSQLPRAKKPWEE